MMHNKILILFCLVLFLHSSASDSTYDNFITCFNNKTQKPNLVYTPKSSSYMKVLNSYVRNRRFNRTTTPKPSVIVTATDQTHVQAAILCAKIDNIQLKIRSGGHDYDGISYVSNVPFIILDMFNLRSITIDASTQTAWVQAGATLGEVYYKISSFNELGGFPAGVCPTVGVGGHLSGGGYGNMIRKYGLSTDHITDAVIVDVNGRVLDRKGMGEDLFWAIRGGGGASFGVVLAYKIDIVPVPAVVTVFRVEKTLAQNATDIVHRFQFVADKLDNDLFIRMLLQPITDKTVKNKKSTKTIRATWISLFLGDADRLMGIMNKQFPELGLKKSDCHEMSWINSVLYWANFDNTTKPEVLLDRNHDTINFGKRKSDYIQTPITKVGLENIWKKMLELGKVGFVFNSYGGRNSEIAATATPFPHRAGNIFKVQYSINWKEEDIATDNNYISQIRSLYSFMTPYVSKSPRGAYLNYRDLDIGTSSNWTYDEGKVYGIKYFMGNFDRLVKVKTAVDPGNFFRNEQSIPPLKA